MRLATSTLIAAVLHGIVLAAATAVLSRPAPSPPVSHTVEVDIIAPRPDPVTDTPLSAPAPLPKADPSPTRSSHHRDRVAEAVRQISLAHDVATTDAPAAEDAPAGRDEPVATPAAPPAGRAIVSKQGPSSGPVGATTAATPHYRSNPAPEYPIACKRRGEEGTVLLNVLVTPNGLPSAVSLNRSSGHPLLDRAALEAVRRWTFEPGRAGGSPIASQVLVPVRFSLSDQP